MQQYRNNRNNGNIYDLRKDLQHTPPPSQQKGSSGSADGRYGFNGEPLSFAPDRTANGNGKVLNLASNYASLFTYLMSGLVVFSIGIPCAISGIAGNLLGSHFALRKGAKFIRPMMLVVLVLLLGKLITDML